MMSAYDYRGFVIVEFPSGVALVHHALPGTSEPDTKKPVVYQARSLGDAKGWVDSYMD